MSGKQNRAKGHASERRLCNVLTNALGLNFVTTRNESHSLDAEGVDVIDKERKFEFHFQVKRYDKNQPRFRDELDKMPDTHYRVCVHDVRYKKPIWVMYEDDALELLDCWKKHRG